MKNKSLLSLTVSLVIVGMRVFAPIPAIAEPDPIFKPIIGETRNKLPSNCPPRFSRGGRGSRGYNLVCLRFSVVSSTLASKYYQKDRQRGSGADAIELSRNQSGYHYQGTDWNTVSWVQDNNYFKIYSGTVRRNELIEIARSMLANSQVISRRSLYQVAQQPKPQLTTWKQFVEEGGGREIRTDYDLPKEFRNGFVYFNYRRSSIHAYILKQGLSNYPPIKAGIEQIDSNLGEKYVKSGKAIKFYWNLGNSGLKYLNDTEVSFSEKGTGRFGITYLTAPFMTNEEISRILRSAKAIPQKN